MYTISYMVNCVIATFNLFDNTQVLKIQWVASGHCNWKLQPKPSYKPNCKTFIFS
jgi:hypothetical protein